jgi:hypothetical protein
MKSTKNIRNIEHTTIQIINSVPETETQLIYQLTKYYDKLLYNSPEVNNSKYCWLELVNILNKNISSIKEDWQINLQKIINNG